MIYMYINNYINQYKVMYNNILYFIILINIINIYNLLCIII